MSFTRYVKKAGIAFLFLLACISFGIWTRAGIVRDIPELEISRNKVERRKFPHYVDRIYDFDHDFDNDNSNIIKVLVVGNSYARDWANILLESVMEDRIVISYSPRIPNDERISESDYIFVYLRRNELPDRFWSLVPDKEKVYGIGTKNFGDCNTIIYSKRFYQKDIHRYSVAVQKKYVEEEKVLQEQWKDQYLSLLKYVWDREEKVRVFTHENKFISYDCYHLSPAGARYFAQRIDWNAVFA